MSPKHIKGLDLVAYAQRLLRVERQIQRVVDRLVALTAERRRLLEAMGKEEGR